MMDELNELRNVYNVNLNTLLFGDDELDLATNKKLFLIVHTFIKKSQRFT